MAAPNSEELALLPKFRERLQDLKLEGYQNSDMYLLRWLRARENSLDLSEEMLRKSLKWRKENDIDSILSWPAPGNLIDNYRAYMCGRDDDNSPIVVVPFGLWNIKKLIQDGHRSDYIRYVDLLFERFIDETKGKFTRDGIPVTQFIGVFDMEGLAMKTLMCVGAVNAILENLSRFEQNHPEVLKEAYVINASSVFTLLFNLIRPILSQRTFGKIQIYNTNSSKWMPILLSKIPSDQLPAVYGGTNKSPETWTQKLPRDDRAHKMTTVSVSSGSSLPIQFEVDEPDSTLKWIVNTEAHDIGISIKFGGGNNTTEVHKYERVGSGKGSLICAKKGTYTLLLDNSFSRYRSKTVRYQVVIISATEKENENRTK